MMIKVPFNQLYMTGKELKYIRQACTHQQLSGHGIFTKRCQEWLKVHVGCLGAFLTHSGTAALEMAALLADIGPGDEVIMPSYTFVSTANAFVMLGGVPVFVDVRPDTLNIDEKKIEAAITKKTKAIVVVHYAGVSCAMKDIVRLAKKHNLLIIEDAAQGIMSGYTDMPLGSIGHLSVISFHETKNITSGQGGALLVNDSRFLDRAGIVWEKGTNRLKFFLGEVDKYTWVDKGSAYPPSELTAAFLWAQMEAADRIMRRRLAVWDQYHVLLKKLEKKGLLRRQIVPLDCQKNAHIYYILLAQSEMLNEVLCCLRELGISAAAHYMPLHNSEAGKKFGRVSGELSVTVDVCQRLVRLPLWAGITKKQVRSVVDALAQVLEKYHE